PPQRRSGFSLQHRAVPPAAQGTRGGGDQALPRVSASPASGSESQGGGAQDRRASAGGREPGEGALETRATRGPLTEATARNDCLSLALEGINGWRLPTYAELAALFYMTGGLQGCPTCAPAIDQAAFADTKISTDYWSSDYDANKMGYDCAE